jgi:uncharacterized protein (DUF58 family)
MAKVGKYRYVQPEALAKLGKLHLIARAVVEGFVTGLHRSPYHGFSVEFSDHREYVRGDNPKDLDWLALARTDRYYIKRYEEETNLRAHILLDTSGSMGYRLREDGLTKLEYGCYLAAALAFLMTRQLDPVGLVTFDEELRSFLPPRSSTRHLNRILQALEAVEPARGTRIGRMFHDLAERIRKRGLIVIVSDLFDAAEAPRELLRGLRHFRHKKHEVLLFHVLDPAEIALPFDRLSEFIDMETGARLQADPAYVKTSYDAQMRDFIEGFRRDCASANIDYVLADSSAPYDLLLQAYLSRRKRAG